MTKPQVTPADITAMSIQRDNQGLWCVIIDQGNGEVVKQNRLTDMERRQLGCLIDPGLPSMSRDIVFVDWEREP